MKVLDKKKSNMLKKVIASIQRSHVIVFNRNRSGLYIIVSMRRKKKLLCFIIDCQRGILLIAMSALYKKNVDIE